VLVGSVLGVVPNPVVVTYVMCKFAVAGLARALRSVVARDRDIHVALVVPGPVDTPMFERAANHLGRALRAVPPACAPERAAAAVVACALRPRRQVPVGAVARVVLAGHRMAPAFTERIVAGYSGRFLVHRRRPIPPTPGTLFDAPRVGEVDGGWRRSGIRGELGRQWGRWLVARAARGDHGSAAAP
jgi:NAD(P)-dependent dehydrogenase (short-subunit alcohol dehydrogenase family)